MIDRSSDGTMRIEDLTYYDVLEVAEDASMSDSKRTIAELGTR